MLPSEVMMSYENLLAEFEDASVGANCGLVETVHKPCACFRHGPYGNVTFECMLHCKDWKWKSSTNRALSNKRVSILLHVCETIRRRDRALLSSTVQVNYLDVVDCQARLLQAFHFDYDPCQRDHAVFHAQITDECIDVSATEADALKMDFLLPEETCAPRLRSARIPTCDMTFPSVLVCLAADHLGGFFFHQFRTRACELQQRMPLPLIPKLRRSLAVEPGDLRSSHWFAHVSR